jgi:hypothetical protein
MQREDMRFDVRTQKYRLRRGEISREELSAHLESLPDEAEEGVETETKFTTPWLDRLAVEEAAADD